MARRTFSVIDVVEVLQHWHAGRPKSVVASSLGVDAKTVRKYVATVEAAGMVPGGPPLGRAEWAELVAGWFRICGEAQPTVQLPDPYPGTAKRRSTGVRA